MDNAILNKLTNLLISLARDVVVPVAVTGILVRRGFRSGRTKIPRKRPDKTVRPRSDFGPGTEVLV